MGQITFKEIGNKTYYSCGCVTETIGENYLIKPCSLRCEVYLFCIEQSKNQGNIVSYQVTEDTLSEPTNIPAQEDP